MRGAHLAPFSEHLREAAEPNLPNLLRHAKKHGLDREHRGYNQGKEKDYSTYLQFSKDTLVETAMDFLSEEAYAQLVRTLGDPSWEADAREDYRKERG